MKLNKDLILTLEFNDLILNFYKLRTIRGTNIFFDDESNFYATWDDLWHVLNHLSNKGDYHWTKLKPNYISKDFRRLILKNLNNHKSKISIENFGKHINAWSNWEKLIFEDISTIDIDISCFNNSKIKIITIDYNSVSVLDDILKLIEPFNDINQNKELKMVNLSNGKTIHFSSSDSLNDYNVIPGDILKVYKLS